MKILQVVTQLEAGGAQGIAYRLHKGFCAAGDESAIVMLYKKEEVGTRFGNVQVISARRPSNVIELLSMTLRLLRVVMQQRPEAVITHTVYSNVIGCLIATVIGVRVRLAVHHSAEPPTGLIGNLDMLLGRLGVYTRVVAVSQSVCDALRRNGPRYMRRTAVVRNGLRLREVPADWNAIGCRGDSVRGGATGSVLVTVGRLAKVKNQQLLLHGLVNLPDCSLLIVGDGELRNELGLLAQELGVEGRVTFLGQMDPDQVPEVLELADLFVFPSMYEGMPVALMEAMAAGLPIVASDIPANRELLGDAGAYFTSDDKSAFVAEVRSLLRRDAYRRELGRLARRRAHSFTEEAMVAGYRQLITEAANKTGGASTKALG